MYFNCFFSSLPLWEDFSYRISLNSHACSAETPLDLSCKPLIFSHILCLYEILLFILRYFFHFTFAWVYHWKSWFPFQKLYFCAAHEHLCLLLAHFSFLLSSTSISLFLFYSSALVVTLKKYQHLSSLAHLGTSGCCHTLWGSSFLRDGMVGIIGKDS